MLPILTVTGGHGAAMPATFHAGRGHDYRTHDVEMHISEIGLCGGHSSSGVWVDENARTTVPGLYAAGDLACVPHNYMIGAFVFGDLAGTHAAAHVVHGALDDAQIAAAHELIYRPLRNPDGPPQPQVEYKLRRFVNDYVAPPKTAAKLDIAVETFIRMTAEIEAMGARTPHELMRCAEVTFIRDCAEMAARSSLTRTERRWGLYHDRADLPERDDSDWFFHLNLRRRPADGAMEFLKRPVAPYLVPVDEFTVPTRDPDPIVLGATVTAAPTAVTRQRRTATSTAARSPRILELLSLADSNPPVELIEPYLSDPDPKVRRAAVATLTEVVPKGVAIALAQALTDEHGSVRQAAAIALCELVEVLPATEKVRAGLSAVLAHRDPVVRSAVLDVLRALGLASTETFAVFLTDEDHRARLQAVRGLVSLNSDAVVRAAEDPSREVRTAVAHALGLLGSAATVPYLKALALDRDPLVRAAALESAAGLGCPPPIESLALAALDDPAWEVWVGAARGLAAGSADTAPQALVKALQDVHLDVREAAVISLARWAADTQRITSVRAGLQ